jgi:hypothetical protein
MRSVQLQQQLQQKILPKGNADSLVFLKDATSAVQNTCAAASAASSPAPVFALAPVSALNSVDVVAIV